jgi:hypothetical protein
MSSNTYIQSYISLKKEKNILNGKTIPVGETLSLTELSKTLYQYLQLDYPKFFKMDELCKLAFIAAEFILRDISQTELSDNQIAVILANASSTLETDRKHQESIRDEQNYFPSPAVFVYTLPNITIGEIAIRHRLKGENSFFITEHYDIPFMHQYVNSMLQHNRAQKVLSGWVEFNATGYDGFLYLAGKEKTGISFEHTTENIDKLYKTGLSV